MSIREQERRKLQAVSRAEGVKARMAGRMREAELVAKDAVRRADEVKRRIEVGDVEPRPLPSVRENSLESMESSPSMPSAELSSGLPEEEAYAGGEIGRDTPLGIDPRGAYEDLGRRMTEVTGAGGDIHLHTRRKADETAQGMTEGTDAGGDTNLHEDRKVDQMANEMLEDRK